MANTYYDSELTGEQIEGALQAIHGVVSPSNNNKVLAISGGKIVARSVQWGGGSAVLEPLSVTANGDYYPGSGVDGFDEVHVAVQGGGAVVQPLSVTANGTYTPPSGVDGYAPVTVNVSGGGAGELMHQGQVSTTSAYATAAFDAGVDITDYPILAVKLFKNGEMIGFSAFALPQSFPFTFSIAGDLSYTMRLTETSIACTKYSGAYYDLFVDVYGMQLP